jgi:transcriptional regulator
MYVPPSFVVQDRQKLAQFIAEYSFATVVTQLNGIPVASHVPLLYQPPPSDSSGWGTLVGHLARPNPHWQAAANAEAAGNSGEAAETSGEIPALAIFHGPHAYISPTWYAEPNTVPTWNYVAVHATGRLRLIQDTPRLLDLLRQTVDFYEASQPTPWRLEDQDQTFIEKLAGGIVGFEIAIDSLEGKWKLNQNHSAARRQRVIEALSNSSRHDDQQVAALMKATKES